MKFARKIHLRENETILDHTQRFWLTLIWNYLLGLLFLFVAFFFMFKLFHFGWWGDAIFGLAIVIGLYIIVRTWFMARHNVLLVTSERVVDIQRNGWLDEVVSSVSLGDVYDASFRKKGLFANIFNYGNLTIETKSRQFVVDAIKIKNPQKFQVLILEAEEKFRHHRRLANIEAVYQSFLKILPDLETGNLLSVHELIRIHLEERGGEQIAEVV